MVVPNSSSTRYGTSLACSHLFTNSLLYAQWCTTLPHKAPVTPSCGVSLCLVLYVWVAIRVRILQHKGRQTREFFKDCYYLLTSCSSPLQVANHHLDWWRHDLSASQHPVFAKVVEGWNSVRRISKMLCDAKHAPIKPVRMVSVRKAI